MASAIPKFLCAQYGLRTLRQSRINLSDRRLVAKHNLFILEAVQAWIDPKQKNLKTVHFLDDGRFAVVGVQLGQSR